MKITGLKKTGTSQNDNEWCVALASDGGRHCGAVTVGEDILGDLGKFSDACRSTFGKTINEPTTQSEWIELLKRLVSATEKATT